jgi:hypothetical protein
VEGTGGKFHFSDLRDNFYEPVAPLNVGNALLQGVEWRGRGGARRWRWVLSGRELYIFARGDEIGLHGFVSTSRLSLHGCHQILTTVRQRDQVLSALAKAECAPSEILDENTSGIPQGWLLFRDVTPTRAIPRRDDDTIPYALCPLHDIAPHFVGGIRLKRRTWLHGFPPRIRFTGEITAGNQIMIDGHAAEIAADGAFESPNWDAPGPHRILYGDKTVEYELRRMEEQWDVWRAHNFGNGAAICGARIYASDLYQARVSARNTLLIGARPGEILRYRTHRDMRSNVVIIFAPFVPVWALPAIPLQADKRSARIEILNTLEPSLSVEGGCDERITVSALREWIAAINDAGRKQLPMVNASEEISILWRRYRDVAKQLWRKTR